MNIPTLLERSFIDMTLKGCCRGAGLCVCTDRQRGRQDRSPELPGLEDQILCLSFHYQHSLPFTTRSHNSFLVLTLKKMVHLQKRRVGDTPFLTLRGLGGEGGIWLASVGNYADMVDIYKKVLRNHYLLSAPDWPLLSGGAAVTSSAFPISFFTSQAWGLLNQTRDPRWVQTSPY